MAAAPLAPIQQRTKQKITGSLFAAQAFFSAGMIASFTLMTIHAAQLSGSNALAGIPNTLTLVGRAIAAYPVGWVLDRIGRRIGVSFGFGINFLGMLIAVWGILRGSFLIFCAGALMMGFSRSALEQMRYIAAEVHSTARRAKVIGLIVFAGTIGAVGGPNIVAPASRLMSRLSWNMAIGPYLAGAIFSVCGFLIVWIFLRPDPKVLSLQVAAEEKGAEVALSERPLRQIFAQPLVLLAVASMAIGQLVMVLLMVITPLHMAGHDHGEAAISFVIMMHTLGMFGLSSVTGWLIDRFGRIPLIILGAVVLIIAAFLTPISTDVGPLALALFLLGLGWNFCFVAGSSLMSDALRPEERGRAQGASDVIIAISSSAGSASTGGLFALGGMITVSSVGFAITLILLALLVWLRISRQLDGAASSAA